MTPTTEPGAAPARPEAFTEFVVKLHARCDLACDYCYVYRPDDDSWRTRPRVPAPATVARTAERIAEHLATHDVPRADLVLHGGEPLLAGPAVLRSVVESVRAAAPGRRIDVVVQTNGVRLTPAHLELFGELGIGVGISLDGPAAVHDRHRPRRDGGREGHQAGSHAAVARAVELLRTTAPDLFRGLLCVIDVDADPIAVYEALAAFEPPAIDLLLPHASWGRPPRRRPGRETEYGDWLGSVFEHWYTRPRPAPTVRLFEELMIGLLGGASAVELVGLSPSAVVVVETDGAIEQVDALKGIAPGAAATGLNVFDDSFDEAWALPEFQARRLGAAGLCEECRSCPVHQVCGEGSTRTGIGQDHRRRRDQGSSIRSTTLRCTARTCIG
ncbi:FxsB family cyclophane-forming radical SAM/SPASM peptide maturase [Catenulispora yoronensis]